LDSKTALTYTFQTPDSLDFKHFASPISEKIMAVSNVKNLGLPLFYCTFVEIKPYHYEK